MSKKKELTAKIQELTVSHTESLQPKQFESNGYFTSMRLDFGDGADLTNVDDTRKVVMYANIVKPHHKNK